MTEERWRYTRLSEQNGAAEEESPRSGEGRSWRIVLFLVVSAGGIVAVCWWGLSSLVDREGEDGPKVAEVDPRRLAESAPPVPAQPEPAPHRPPTWDPDAPLPETVPELMEEAEQVVDRLVERFPDDPQALDCMAKTQFYLGRSTTASEYWNRCLELDPQSDFACAGLSRIAAIKGDYEEVAALLHRAVTLRPASADPGWLSDKTCDLADTLTKLGKVDEAIATLEENVRVNPRLAKSRLLLGQLYLQSRKYEKAKGEFEEAVRIRPALSHGHFGLATALARTGDRERSSLSMERFKELRAKESAARTGTKSKDEEPKVLARTIAMTYAHAGQIYRNIGDMEEAERHWRRASLLSPQNTACRTFLAILYQETNRLPEAVETCKQLAAIEPANPIHLWQLGVLSARLGRVKEAETAFESVVEAAPLISLGYAALAKLYLETNQNLDEAERLAREAVRIDPIEAHRALLSRVCEKTGRPVDDATSAADGTDELPPENPERQGE